MQDQSGGEATPYRPPRILFEGLGLAGVCTSFQVLGWGSFPSWEPSEPGCDRAVHTVQFEGAELVVDKGSGRSRYRAPLDALAQSAYARSRRDSLERLDGIVFVADVQKAREFGNQERLELLVTDVALVGRSAAKIPLVFQLNKVDLLNPPEVEERAGAMLRALPWPGPSGHTLTSATVGYGIPETIHMMLAMFAHVGDETSSHVAAERTPSHVEGLRSDDKRGNRAGCRRE